MSYIPIQRTYYRSDGSEYIVVDHYQTWRVNEHRNRKRRLEMEENAKERDVQWQLARREEIENEGILRERREAALLRQQEYRNAQILAANRAGALARQVAYREEQHLRVRAAEARVQVEQDAERAEFEADRRLHFQQLQVARQTFWAEFGYQPRDRFCFNRKFNVWVQLAGYNNQWPRSMTDAYWAPHWSNNTRFMIFYFLWGNRAFPSMQAVIDWMWDSELIEKDVKGSLMWLKEQVRLFRKTWYYWDLNRRGTVTAHRVNLGDAFPRMDFVANGGNARF